MNREEGTAASNMPPSVTKRFWNAFTSKRFWESLAQLNFWEQGCLGRSMAAGAIVGTLAGFHRYRTVRVASKSVERGALGFLFGLSINYFSCRQIMEEVARRQGPISLRPPSPDRK